MATKNPTLAHESPAPDCNNSISLSFHTGVARCISRVEEGRNIETVSVATSERSSYSFQNVWLKYCSGGTLLDATIIEAAQQVGDIFEARMRMPCTHTWTLTTPFFALTDWTIRFDAAMDLLQHGICFGCCLPSWLFLRFGLDPNLTDHSSRRISQAKARRRETG